MVAAVNSAIIEPTGAVAVGGIITPALLVDKEMLTLPPAFDSVITQTVPVPPTSAAGEQDIEDRVGVVQSVSLNVVEVPPRAAVSVADPSAVMVAAVAISVPVALPAATTTVPGTVTNAEDELIVTFVLAAAGPLRATVHTVAPPVIRPVGLHTSDLRLGATLKVMFADCEVPA
jgi:hypothetical protein